MTHFAAKFLTLSVLLFSLNSFAQEQSDIRDNLSLPPMEKSVAVVCLGSTLGAVGNIGLNTLEVLYSGLQKTTNFVAGSALESTAIVAQQLGFTHFAADLKSTSSSQITLNFVTGRRNLIDYSVNLARLAQQSSDSRLAFEAGITDSYTYLAIGSAVLNLGRQLYQSSVQTTANIFTLVVAGFSQENTADIEDIKELCSDMGYVATTVVGYKLITKALPTRKPAAPVASERLSPTIDSTKMESLVSEMSKKIDLENAAGK